MQADAVRPFAAEAASGMKGPDQADAPAVTDSPKGS